MKSKLFFYRKWGLPNFFLAILLMNVPGLITQQRCYSQIKSSVEPSLIQIIKPDFSKVPARELNTFRNFQEAFDGDNKINAYLLSYVSCFVYPERIHRLLTGEIWNDDDPDITNDALFESNFKKKFEPLFWDGTSSTTKPVISFKRLPLNSPARSIGLDPEAVVISTSEFIIVAFRGTDRVLSQNDLNRAAGEWIGTDFRAPMVAPGPGLLVGKVHEGFWKSIDLLRSDLDTEISQNNPNHNKQIWITGHSLGAAQAQIYAQYLIHSGKVSSSKIHCYMYDGPSFVGDQDFANQVNALGNKFQRFEYQSDLVSTIAPGLATAVSPAIAAVLGNGCIINCVYRKSGKRNWFESPTTYRFNFREREFVLGDVFTLNSGCEHNPNWLVRALYNRLSDAERSTVPDQAPCINLGVGCNPANSCTPISIASLSSDIITAVEEIAWTALSNLETALENLGTNLVGGGNGNYKIACYEFRDWTKKYLTWDGTIGSQLTISKTGTIFTLTKKTTGGYRISKGTGNMSADVEFNAFGFPTGNERTNNVIMRQHDNIVGDEETWYLLKIPNAGNSYVLYNWNTKKVLDAPNNCTAGGDCRVNEAGQKSNEATQVWVLEKIN